MAKQTGESCHIADQHCLAPAGYGINGGGGAGANNNLPDSLPECPACGQPVCENCAYENGLCRECYEESGEPNATFNVLMRQYALAGYNNARAMAEQAAKAGDATG